MTTALTTSTRHEPGTGQQNSPASDLTNLEGRFFCTAPLGFAGGDVNLYRYVKNNPINRVDPSGLVIEFRGRLAPEADSQMSALLAKHGLDTLVIKQTPLQLNIGEENWSQWRLESSLVTPGGDTTDLCQKFNLKLGEPDDILKEIVLAMLHSNRIFSFRSWAAFEHLLSARQQVVKAALEANMKFSTKVGRRPGTEGDEKLWVLLKGDFVIAPDADPLDALEAAVSSGETVTACYKAVELTWLLGLLPTLRRCDPQKAQELENELRSRAVEGEEFRQRFTRPDATEENPLPLKHFVPGDWVWFKNPDERSSNFLGFEGSNTIYVGCGKFASLWSPGPRSCKTLNEKLIGIWAWRLKEDVDDISDERIVQKMSEQEKTEKIREIFKLQKHGGCMPEWHRCPVWNRPKKP